MTKIVADLVKNTAKYWEFKVTLTDAQGYTEHNVKIQNKFMANFNEGVLPNDVIVASFEFLLTKEPKEMIYKEFDVEVIGKFFPDYLAKLKNNFS